MAAICAMEETEASTQWGCTALHEDLAKLVLSASLHMCLKRKILKQSSSHIKWNTVNVISLILTWNLSIGIAQVEIFQSFHPGVTARMPSGRIAVCWCDARDKQSQQPALISYHTARARAAPCFGLLQCVTFAEDKCESVIKCHCWNYFCFIKTEKQVCMKW